MNLILIISFVMVVSYILFQTDALPEYGGLFGIGFLKSKEYNENKKTTNFDYPQFMIGSYNNFFVRLLFCPECSNVWLNIIAFLVFQGSWAFIGWGIILTWILNPLLVYIMRQVNELND